VIAALGFSDDEQAPDQLHGLAMKHAEIHEVVELYPCETVQRQRSLLHGVLTVRDGVIGVNATERIR